MVSLVPILVSAFSPLHSGQVTAMATRATLALAQKIFQSPPFGASHCNNGWIDRPRFWYRLSVPSIRGKPLQCQLFEAECTGNTAFSPLHSGQATAMMLITGVKSSIVPG